MEPGDSHECVYWYMYLILSLLFKILEVEDDCEW